MQSVRHVRLVLVEFFLLCLLVIVSLLWKCEGSAMLGTPIDQRHPSLIKIKVPGKLLPIPLLPLLLQPRLLELQYRWVPLDMPIHYRVNHDVIPAAIYNNSVLPVAKLLLLNFLLILLIGLVVDLR